MVKSSVQKLFLCALCILMVQFLYGQENNRADSLIESLRFTHDARAKTRLLLRISKEEELSDPEKSLEHAKQARLAAQKSGYDSAEVRAMILIGGNLNRLTLLKEAIEIGGEVIEKASKENMQLEIADGRTIIAVAFAQVGDYDNSSKLFFENLKLYESLNEKRLLASTLGNIGADFFSQQSYEKAIEYINKALKIAKEIDDQILITDQYNNLAAIYQIKYHNYPKALHYYFEALKIAVKINDFQQQGINMINIGRVYREMNKPDSAVYFMNQSLAMFQKVNNPVNMADVYMALSEHNVQTGNLSSGKELAHQALIIGEKYQMLQTIYGASDLLQKIYLQEKDSANAFKYIVIRTKVSDSLNTLQSQKALFKAELQYNQEKTAKEQKLRQQKNYFILGFVILGLISGLFIAILFNSRQKIRIKNTTLEKDRAESELKFKSKELSINILALLKKNELITEIRQKLTDLEKGLPKNEIKDIVAKFNHEIKMSSDDRLWQEFSMRFKEINIEFYDKLLSKYPDLTQSELKLCAYLRLNMSTKEISELTGQSTETLGKARYRLRKKFDLTNSESNLVIFLSQI